MRPTSRGLDIAVLGSLKLNVYKNYENLAYKLTLALSNPFKDRTGHQVTYCR